MQVFIREVITFLLRGKSPKAKPELLDSQTDVKTGCGGRKRGEEGGGDEGGREMREAYLVG